MLQGVQSLCGIMVSPTKGGRQSEKLIHMLYTAEWTDGCRCHYPGCGLWAEKVEKMRFKKRNEEEEDWRQAIKFDADAKTKLAFYRVKDLSLLSIPSEEKIVFYKEFRKDVMCDWTHHPHGIPCWNIGRPSVAEVANYNSSPLKGQAQVGHISLWMDLTKGRKKLNASLLRSRKDRWNTHDEIVKEWHACTRLHVEYEGREGRKDKRIEVYMEKEKKSMVEVTCCLFLN